ncbi:unnamed protein product [Effrenium voratum]|nr:unnamed protein product [Effrenium voratum]
MQSQDNYSDGLNHASLCVAPDDEADAAAQAAEKELKAAKARLRRLCEEKKNGKIKVPEWLHDKLMSLLEKSHSKKDSKQNKIEEGWYSKEDMSKVLKWGEPEYWVSIRETGTRLQEEQTVEKRKTTTQEDGDNIPTLNFQAMNSYRARINAAQQQKNHFQKFIDSILAKSAKMRALVADLKRNYSDEMATKSAVALESDVAMMDEQHNTCCEHLAKGNVEDFGEELLGSVVGIWGNAFSMKCGC